MSETPSHTWRLTHRTLLDFDFAGNQSAARIVASKVSDNGASTVMRSQEYRSKGAACLLAAENSKLSADRAGWLSMAQAWFKLAKDVDRKELMVSDDAPYSN
jgi:hypothetical protein